MPWHIEHRDSEYCVIKDDDNSVEGCHPTRAEAQQQLEALYANADAVELGKRRKNREREDKHVPFYLIKADPTEGIVESIVSVMGIIDLGDDVIHNGAYTKTITERTGRIRVLDNHNTDSTLRAVGIPLEMREVGAAELASLAPQVLKDFPEATGGLYCRTKFLIDTPEGEGVFKRIAAGAINEWSIGYDAIISDRGKVVDPASGLEKVVRHLRELRLWEYSPVLWGMNQATAVVGVKENNMPKAQTDAAGYRSVEATAATRCASCVFFRELNDTQGYCKRFDFVAGSNMLCDSFKSGKGASEPVKETSPAGEVTSRLGDYLAAKTYGEFMEVCNDCLEQGVMSDTEHRAMCDLGLKVLDTIRAGMTADLSLRPYAGGGMDMMFLWAADGADARKLEDEPTDAGKAAWLLNAYKAGRVLSAKNATKISAAVDSLLEVLINAGIYTSAESEDPSASGEQGKDIDKAGSPLAPTEIEAIAATLEAELLEVELGGLKYHA